MRIVLGVLLGLLLCDKSDGFFWFTRQTTPTRANRKESKLEENAIYNNDYQQRIAGTGKQHQIKSNFIHDSKERTFCNTVL